MALGDRRRKCESRSTSGHRHRLEAIELVACWLAFLPGEELPEGHRLASGATFIGCVLARLRTRVAECADPITLTLAASRLDLSRAQRGRGYSTRSAEQVVL